MAVYIVNTTDDTVAAGDGKLSLREALAVADVTDVADTVRFSAAVQGGTIVLAGSQLTVNSDVTIDGGDGVTLNANQRSRVLMVAGEGTEAALAHLTITGGRAKGDYGSGGGILGIGYTILTLDDVAVLGNRAEGGGGGIQAFFVSLSNCTVQGNGSAGGGGISAYDVNLRGSSVSDNRTQGIQAEGGGISATYVSLVDSTVSGNSTSGDNAHGGGISGYLIGLTNSTVSGNHTTGKSARGGGIYGWDSGDGGVHLYNSTVSDNHTEGKLAGGGGISGDWLVLTNSTITANRTSGTGRRRRDLGGRRQWHAPDPQLHRCRQRNQQDRSRRCGQCHRE